MAKTLQLETLSEKSLHQPVDPRLITYCPSMDLVALATTDQQVFIYRLNGQRVYGAAQKTGSLRVESIKWKPNGRLLAIAWSDGSVRLIGAESSKVVHHFSASEGVSGVTCMGWGSNLTGNSTSSLSEKKTSASWEELLSSESILSEKKTPLDLPRDLSLIDIERSLPKLSILAAGGSSEDVFSSRASLDAIFQPFDPKDNNAVDVMVVGTDAGQVHLSIYDSFVVGSFASPTITGGKPLQLISHASHKQCSTHPLLMKSPGADRLYFIPMDLRFISTSSDHLSLLASRSTSLQNLLRYIDQVQIQMVSEWKSTQELPGRFLRNINETLGESGDRDIVQALYHSVATGHTFPAVKEWLVDELAERGLKRWEKAVSTGLETLRKLVHENMLPALERCSLILSRFSGIAKFSGPNDTLGFSSQQISLIMDTVACLHLVSAKILIQVVDEIDLFAAFSGWLRYEIDRLASDASTTPKDDEIEKEASIDHSKVLVYLQTCMTTSPLEVYLGDCTADEYKPGWNHAGEGHPMFDILDKQLQKQERGLSYMKPLPRIELLCKLLTRQAKKVFGQIAEAEKRNVLFGKAEDVGIAVLEGPMDISLSQMTPGSHFETYIAFLPKELPSTVQITKVGFSIENGISKVHSIDSSAIQLGTGQIRDLKVFHSDSLLIIWAAGDESHILRIPYANPIDYFPHVSDSGSPHPTTHSNEEVVQLFSKYQIPDGGAFVPEKLEVRFPSNSDDNVMRIVILGKDRLHYKVFSLPNMAPAKRRRAGYSDEDISMT